LNGINQEIDAFTNLLKNKFPKYAALKYENKTAKAKEVQALLDDKTAILEYIIGDSVIYIFYVDKQQVKINALYLSNKVLNEKIKQLHSALSNYKLVQKDPDKSYTDFTENAHWFYENLVKLALSNAKGITQLIIIPDGELAHLPFEAFLVEKVKENQPYNELRYLLNDYKISYNYSATLWKENKETKHNKNNGQLFALAADYESKGDSLRNVQSSSLRNLRDILQALPAARKEVESLQKAYRGFFAFDSLASEKNFKAKAGEYAVIHLAMHGLLDQKNPILSSLAFTEDGDSIENNFLQAYEISKMQLNADLVVLSACETGFGKFEKGNGTASLARAFMYAGVPSLVVSLWQVNDVSTSAIMQLFYKNLAKGMDKAEALQQAKLEYIKMVGGRDAINRVPTTTTTAAHPAFWAAFVLIGDERPIAIATKSGGMMWWIVGGIAVLVGAGGFFALRRRK
jgi:CHAT domain-containing protein